MAGETEPTERDARRQAKADAAAERARAKASRPWYQKKRYMIPLVLLALIVVISALSGDPEQPVAGVTDSPQTEVAEPTQQPPTAAPAEGLPAPTAPAPTQPAGTPAPPAEQLATAPAPPAEQPPPAPGEPSFDSGTLIVGQDVAPGAYRSDGEGICYWARVSGFSNELEQIIANGNTTPEIVTIEEGDAGFQSQGCGTWRPVAATAPAAPAETVEEGTFQIGVHLAPGSYRADGAAEDLCYWARLVDFTHELDGIITNGNSPTVVEIAPTDAGFTTSGCGVWTRIG